uniref:hypothetical protein n=1 Tax=Neorhizobium sp. EC2-8 TaxID=3129230 RepID=UPI00310178BE
MKSPWKFLSRFRSSRQTAEIRDNSVEDESDIEPSESGLRQISAPSSSSTEQSRHPEQNEDPVVDLVATTASDEIDSEPDVTQPIAPLIDGEEVRTPARHEIDPSGADAHALAPETETDKKSPRTPRAKPPGRAKRTRADVVSESTIVANSDETARAKSPRESFFDDVTSVDEEIRQLRSQLAQKLRLQNAQLAEMLARFDRS